jgi:drug/metabolite transporter (DMT)-like permease
MNGKTAPFFILLAGVLWGTTGTTQAFAPESAHPIAIGAARLAAGGLFLLCMVFLAGKLDLKNWPIKNTLMASLLYGPVPAIVLFSGHSYRGSHWDCDSDRECTGLIGSS